MIYDIEYMRSYIERNRDKIEYVECGLDGNWHNTAQIIYQNGSYANSFRSRNPGLTRSLHCTGWSIPVMWVKFKDCETPRVVECWKEKRKRQLPRLQVS